METTCKNCTHTFHGNYCPNCGQSIKEINRPFRVVIYDFAGTVFAFDTRLIKSLKALILYPGKLSHDFTMDKRARYMPPFQMFVFISFVFFLILSFSTRKMVEDLYASETALALVSDTLLKNTKPVNDTVNLIIAPIFSEKKSTHPLNLKYQVENILNSDSSLNLEQRNILERVAGILSDPKVYFATIYKYLSWGFFLLMPVFAILLMPFFKRKDFFYTAHLTLSINLHSYLFLTMLLFFVLKLIFKDLYFWVLWLFILQFLIYEVLALRKMYGKRLGRTIIRMLLVNGLYLAIFLIFAVSIPIIAFMNL